MGKPPVGGLSDFSPALRMNPQGLRLRYEIAKSRVVDLNPEREESRCLLLSLVVIGIQVAVLTLFYLMGSCPSAF